MARRRTGITRYVGNMVDNTKDFVDDVLDRSHDLEDDLRETGRRALEDRDDDRNSRGRYRDDRNDRSYRDDRDERYRADREGRDRDSRDLPVSRQLAEIRDQLADLAGRLDALTLVQGGGAPKSDSTDRAAGDG